MPDFIVPGVTTREDVLMNLGEADWGSKGGSELNYVSSNYGGGVLVLLPLPAQLPIPIPVYKYDTYQQRTLIVQFDEAGLVEGTRLETQSCSVHFDFGDYGCVPAAEPAVPGDSPKAATPEPED